jgi:diguanylate cyclase (GGDEF)-like protein
MEKPLARTANRESGSGIDPRVVYGAKLLIVAAAYFGSGKAGLEFAFANESVTAVWPPTGLALAAVLLWGYRMWPAIAVGAFLANVTTAGPVWAVSGIALGNTLEALVGAYLLRHFADFRPTLERVSDVVGLVVYAACCSTAVSATIGVASLSAAGLVEAGETVATWRTWWLGDAAGDLIVAPALLVLASRPSLPKGARIAAEAAILVAALAAVTLVTFSIDDPLIYLVFPVLLWIALRFQQPGMVVAALIVSGLAVWFTARGHGPFIGGSADAELLRAQTFVGVASITGLLLAALATERERVEARLRRLADRDPLTGLLNRRRFAEELERWIAHCARYGDTGAVLVIDVDSLKLVNDLAGHAAGDDLLTHVAIVLEERLRDTDVVARLGGDEFTILLPSTDRERAVEVAKELLERVHERVRVSTSDGDVRTSLSIGVCAFSDEAELTPDQILVRADRAMYRVKLEGGSGVLTEDEAQPSEPPPVRL